MRLEEQRYGRGKVYYHGSRIHDRVDLTPTTAKGAKTKVLYVTGDLEYAFEYVRTYLYVCRLKRDVNLFNGHSRLDGAKLRKKIKLTDQDEMILKHNDWIFFDKMTLGNVSNKGYLIDVIAELGYDGFYNNENVDGSDHEGIGLFSSDPIEVTACYSAEDAVRGLKGLRRISESKRSSELIREFLSSSGIDRNDLRREKGMIDVNLSRHNIGD